MQYQAQRRREIEWLPSEEQQAATEEEHARRKGWHETYANAVHKEKTKLFIRLGGGVLKDIWNGNMSPQNLMNEN